MKRILLMVLICLSFCGLSILAAPIKQDSSPEANTIIKNHHAGPAPAHVSPPMHHGGGQPPMGRPMGPPMGPPPPPHHHQVMIAPYYIGTRYASPYYYPPYNTAPYEYYDSYYVYPVRRPVIKYRVPNVGFTVMY